MASTHPHQQQLAPQHAKPAITARSPNPTGRRTAKGAPRAIISGIVRRIAGSVPVVPFQRSQPRESLAGNSLYKPTILSLYKHHNHVLSRKGRPVLDLRHEGVSSEVYRWRRSEFIWHIRATPRLAFAQAATL